MAIDNDSLTEWTEVGISQANS